MSYNLLLKNSLVRCMTIFVIIAVSPSIFARDSSYSKTNRKYTANYSNKNGMNSVKSLIAGNVNKRSWEFRTAPIALIARWFTLDVSYRLSDQWATGPAAILYNAEGPGGMLSPSYKGYAVGWNGNYYFNSVYKNTWYVSAHTYYESYKSYPHAYLGYKEIDGFKANSVIGYQWKWSRINMMTGIGAEFRNQNVVDRKDAVNSVEQSPIESRDSFWLPHIEFKMGIEI